VKLFFGLTVLSLFFVLSVFSQSLATVMSAVPFSLGGRAMAMANNHLEILVIVFFAVVAWIAIRRLGIIELDTMGRPELGSAFRCLHSSDIVLKTLISRLTAASNVEEWWRILESSFLDLGFCQIQLHLAGQSFSAGHADPATACWRVEIPLHGSAYISLAHEFNVDLNPAIMNPLAIALHQTLTSCYARAGSAAPRR
jgi:hypothetical protein